SYPAITATVNVATNASSPQVLAMSVSGGGSAAATFNDPTTIVSPPKIISISSSPSPPIANQVANLTVNRTGFDPNSAFFTVSGPGCNTTNCTVPNSALTIKTTNQLIGAFRSEIPLRQRRLVPLHVPVTRNCYPGEDKW